jgi:hypothetical protein
MTASLQSLLNSSIAGIYAYCGSADKDWKGFNGKCGSTNKEGECSMGLLNEKTKQKKTRQHKFIKP